MADLTRVQIMKTQRFADSRGFLHKVLAASQCPGGMPNGEVYVSAASPGEVKGNHYHLLMGEWFAAIRGSGTLELRDPTTGDGRSIALSADSPQTVFVPAGVAHAVHNTGQVELICVACAECEHDPSDVYPCVVVANPTDLGARSGRSGTRATGSEQAGGNPDD